MIISAIRLSNIGVFSGINASPSIPIVRVFGEHYLICGMNRSRQDESLESVLLALYGRRPPSSMLRGAVLLLPQRY